eukprot:TRINITY_DN886_c0_g1_i1.p2 TRINITY_DN886_c0_g1~~TRINITY_DN886_c0_g1_i1.p2  ORF type:complete len:150 (-),score=10.61 TRINITY_DN886_c0_g1_i1:43-492(-)
MSHFRKRYNNSAVLVQGIDHVAVCVENMDAQIQWYSDVIGLEHRFADHPDFGKDPAMMCSGNTCVALIPPSSPTCEPLDNRRTGKTHVLDHIAFRMDRFNFDRAVKDLPRYGIHPKVENHGIQESMYFPDPEGNTVELTTWEFPCKAET